MKCLVCVCWGLLNLLHTPHELLQLINTREESVRLVVRASGVEGVEVKTELPQPIEVGAAGSRTVTTSLLVDPAAAKPGSRPLPVLVDVDPGIRRTGVASPEAALALAQRITAATSLRFAGVQFYCGAQQHIEKYEERRAATEERTAYLRSVVDTLNGAGVPFDVVTGSGTGTHRIVDAALGVFTELQAGSGSATLVGYEIQGLARQALALVRRPEGGALAEAGNLVHRALALIEQQRYLEGSEEEVYASCAEVLLAARADDRAAIVRARGKAEVERKVAALVDPAWRAHMRRFPRTRRCSARR